MSTASPLRVLIAGGGTGGHLYPGIAVARELVRRDPAARVTFVGTAAGLEARVVPREGFELDVIRSAGLKGKSPGALARGVATLPASALDAWRVLSSRRPHLAIGLGGYSSGPVLLLAAARRIPTLLMEQNAVPGVTNRLLARVVRAAAVTYEASLPYFGTRGFVSGNPVRPEFLEARADAAEAGTGPAGRLRVLVFGGSQGAHAINRALIAAAPLLAASPIGFDLTHQTGERDLAEVRAAYASAGLPARVEPFLYDMHRELLNADLIVCRAGATTLAELAAAGRPAVLIPLPTATDDHQRRNAEVLARAGAALVLDQRELTGSVLVDRLVSLARSPEERVRMARAMKGFARPGAAAVIVDRALALARESRLAT